MSLRLLVDEDTQEKRLVDLLRKAGHDVLTINELKLQDSDDTVVFDCAKKQTRVVLTKNCRDYQTLNQLNSSHPGILGIYQYNYPPKDMGAKDIVKAISNLEALGISLANQFITLNQFKY